MSELKFVNEFHPQFFIHFDEFTGALVGCDVFMCLNVHFSSKYTLIQLICFSSLYLSAARLVQNCLVLNGLSG